MLNSCNMRDQTWPKPTRATLLIPLLAALSMAGCSIGEDAPFCYGDGMCVCAGGYLCLDDGQPICELTDSCGDADGTGATGGAAGDTGAGAAGGGAGATGGAGGSGGTVPPGCHCPVTENDSDGDCIPDSVEDANGNGIVDPPVDVDGDGCIGPGDIYGESDPNNPDTDGDGIRDGCEDRNRNGVFDPTETQAFHHDTDCDGIPDGIEDANQDGVYDPLTETHPLLVDTDKDGIPDGLEDRNRNGIVDQAVDLDGDGCIGPNDIPGESNPRSVDSDGDQILDSREDRNLNGICDPGETCAWNADTDCDELPDGVEDLNRNGVVNTGETDPLNPDTDGDGLPDGLEDANKDGRWTPDETNPRLYDTDGDSIPDGKEDRNRNGVVDVFDDSVNGNGDGCYDEFEEPGETDPRNPDTDGDGIPDNVEDRDQDGECLIIDQPDPLNPSRTIRVFAESCAFMADTDCDGIPDGIEDANRNGTWERGETDAKRRDTDLDGLMDGCPEGVELCEDKNNNGIVDPGETDPRNADTDGDGLTDGCELMFGMAVGDTGGPTDPLNPDTDGDGFADGEEDGNQNCIFEPHVDNCTPPSSCFETDPRVFNAPPQSDTIEYAEWSVCSTRNLKRITYAEAQRQSLDYRLAFEVERHPTTKTCGTQGDCGQNEVCVSQQCVAESTYFVQGFGEDTDGDGFSVNDLDDVVLGHVFQSGRGVMPAPDTPGELAHRNIYGFLQVKDEGGSLATVMQNLSAQLLDLPSRDSHIADVEQIGDLTPRPAHDNLPSAQYPDAGTYRISYAQRIFRVSTGFKLPSFVVRNKLLTDSTFVGSTPLSPPSVPPNQDLVYGAIDCNSDPYCHSTFTVYISAVQRLDQTNRNGGKGSVVFTVALTEDDRCGPAPLPACPSPGAASTTARLYNDRKARLEDLTGGSALARFEADTGKVCDRRDQQMAVADLLWVVDDSRSMQQIITRLQQASRDAQAVLTSNSGIVDFRVAMTTTNPSPSVRTRCHNNCGPTCGGASCDAPDDCDPHLGCLKVCPPGCSDTCTGGSCVNECVGSCLTNPTTNPGPLDAAITFDATGGGEYGEGDFFMPGGGGNFYYEDTYYLDCDSAPDATGIDDCSTEPGFSPFFSGGSNFNGVPRVRLTANAGFLGSDPFAACDTQPMSLLAQPSTCLPNDPECCLRLTEACTDGPTVLASQMCDLIRAMGGLPQVTIDSTTSSARNHSAPELGSRQARRLMERMLPALPADYETTCTAPCPYQAKNHLRLTCSTAQDPNCQPCDPRVEDNCPVVPMVTIFLSDEEDFLFKDDCANGAAEADKRQLPTQCRMLDGDSSTLESCDPCELRNSCTDDGDCIDPATCTNGVCSCDTCEAVSLCSDDSDCPGACINGRCGCSDDTDCNPGSSCIAGKCGCDRGAYCEDPSNMLAIAPPTGFNPDATARANSTFSVAWRDSNAMQCDASAFNAPPADCPPPPATLDALKLNPEWYNMGTNCRVWASELQALASTSCSHNPCADQDNEYACKALNIDIGNGAEPYCDWAGGMCVTRCSTHGAGDPSTPSELKPLQCACDGSDPSCSGSGDPLCEWVQANVDWFTSKGRDACQPKYELSDCRACKRFTRTLDAVHGSNNDPWFNGGGSALVGVGELGPVYAITRDQGQQGFGGYPLAPEDECGGGRSTWALGDGQAYRDLARETRGRTQNVCADSYADFLGLVIQDIAALSAPYPLSGQPIASTIKVGIARPEGGGYRYIEVPRSTTQGFFYDATQNTIAFKSDPIDGVCAPGDVCTVDPNSATFEQSEINYARDADTVPRELDTIFVSYRTWRAVPCQERCGDNESCLRAICAEDTAAPACPGGTDLECPLNYVCDTVDNQCKLDCSPGELVDVCVPNQECPPCQISNPATGLCEPVGSLCDCNPGGVQTCSPGAAGGCPMGFTCDENCGCTPIPGCGGGFNGDTSMAQCEIDKQCCLRWEQAASMCRSRVCSDNGDPCASDVHCNAGATCLGMCNDDGSPCANDAACNSNATCDNRQCADNAEPCTTGADCNAGVACVGACSDDASACSFDSECNSARCVGALDQLACESQPVEVCELLGLAYQSMCDNDGSPCTHDGQCGGGNCINPSTCAGSGAPCTGDAQCGDAGPCLTPCQLAAPCEYDEAIGCDFTFPTCCGEDETVDCFLDQETGEGSLFCRTECQCDPACGYYEVCEPLPGLNTCHCFFIGP